MNKDLEAKYLSVIEDNVNVGKTSDGKEFFILLAGIVAICIAVYLSADLIAGVWIDYMSDSTQRKIEQSISFGGCKNKNHIDNTNESLLFLESIKPKIIAMDKKLQGKSDFPIHKDESKEINAYVSIDGTIHFTEGLLNEMKDQEALTFVLAHELAHYAHRDHLKSMGRELIAGAVLTVLSGGQGNSSNVISSVSEATGLTYSQNQEKMADLYANEVLIKLYGRNDGAIKFFRLLQEKENIPEFLYYFSTHPSTSSRIKILKQAK